MRNFERYETKPLECWQKMKELRRDHVRHLWKSREKDEPLIIGTAEIFQSLPAGLGDYAGFGLGPNFGGIIRDRDLTIKCLEALEVRGFGRDICGICRVNLGSMFLGIQTRSRSGEAVKPDFCYQLHACEPLGKTTQLMSEEYNIPYFIVEMPFVGREGCTKYLISQMQDAIEFMEKVTDREYDDERLIEAVYNEWRSMVLWARVCELNKAIPAPIDLRHLASLIMPLWTGKHRRDTAEFYQMLFDEVQDRVQNKISARGLERCRLMHFGQWPWYLPSLLRFPERYGAVFIGADVSFGTYGAFVAQEDGSWKTAKTLEEQGIELKTREDALRSLVELYMFDSPMIRSFFLFSSKSREHLKMLEDWHADAAVFNLAYDCKGVTAAQMETRLAFQKKGVPSLLYEVSSADPRDFTESQIINRFESFLETLGLGKLEE